MSQKAVAAPEGPSLDDWMAKIREKKLRPVIPNQHKSKEDLADKKEKSSMGPHEVNEIVKMRQGLRSVSTPKWPGVNDNKAKTNTTTLPSRAQLRSVSDRTVQASEKTSQLTEQIESSDVKSSAAAIPKEEEEKLEQVDEGAFPLDAESVAEQKAGEGHEDASAQELSASSGIVDPSAKIDLKLPKVPAEDFPLDHETTLATDNQDDADHVKEEMKTPVTLSTGVFDTNNTDLKLKLPSTNEDDFPLDVEDTKTANVSEVVSTESLDLGASSGATEPTSIVPVLEAPPKVKAQSAEEDSPEAAKAQSKQADLGEDTKDLMTARVDTDLHHDTGTELAHVNVPAPEN